MEIKHKILKGIIGSNLYGTNTPDSDKDYMGIFVADEEYYIGLKNVEEVDESIIKKDESGKNTKEAIDKKYYEIRQFFKLAMQNNPNIIEILFLNNDNILESHFIWDLIQTNREWFLNSKQIKNRFLGYAMSQKHKMFVKLENYDILKEAYDILDNSMKKFLIDEEVFNKFKFRENINTEYRVADIFVPRNISIKRAKEILQERLKRVGNRQELILKYGMDTKFSSHLIRILLECKELLLTKNIEFPLKERQLIIDIKTGKYKCEEIIKMADELEVEINSLKIKEYKQDYNELNALLIDIIKNFLFGRSL